MEEDLQRLLDQHGLAAHQAVFRDQGYHRVEQLVQLNEDQTDDLKDALRDNEAPRNASRALFRELRERERERAPPVNEAYVHFSGLAQRINSSDVSGLEEATVLKVDVDPLDQIPDRFHVPSGSLCRFTQASSLDPVPVVSLIGPTGAGKSLLASTFMQTTDGILAAGCTP
ncbi:unnamed protein product [Symbiodinium natans]|uniref:SAM domain-containing protein n=1 Tax=Symbiodinium natans TaxID=878477 RepID=A0A812LPT5_9DINO|nr:unnamed protein product [Symbiodinium natans]